MNPQLRCAVCGLETSSARRGLCPICDERLRTLVAVGEACALCGLSDGRVLRPARLGESVVCLCRNHAWIAESSAPPPRSLEELRVVVAEPDGRRSGQDRRSADRRVRDRRVAEADRRRGHRIPDKTDRRVRDRRASC